MKALEFVVGIIMVIAGTAAVLGIVSLFTALPIWLLWNWLVPGIFGLPEIGYFQAFGLYVLCHMLFGELYKAPQKDK